MPARRRPLPPAQPACAQARHLLGGGLVVGAGLLAGLLGPGRPDGGQPQLPRAIRWRLGAELGEPVAFSPQLAGGQPAHVHHLTCGSGSPSRLSGRCPFTADVEPTCAEACSRSEVVTAPPGRGPHAWTGRGRVRAIQSRSCSRRGRRHRRPWTRYWSGSPTPTRRPATPSLAWRSLVPVTC